MAIDTTLMDSISTDIRVYIDAKRTADEAKARLSELVPRAFAQANQSHMKNKDGTPISTLKHNGYSATRSAHIEITPAYADVDAGTWAEIEALNAEIADLEAALKEKKARLSGIEKGAQPRAVSEGAFTRTYTYSYKAVKE